jgi:MFS family permease
MTETTAPAHAGPGWLNKEATVAKPGFNRWFVPPAALAIHLCIGMSYGLSVFWLPLSHTVYGLIPVECLNTTLGSALVTTSCNWRISDLIYTFTIGIVVLGLSAALFGGWLERAGPRKAGLIAAVCWGGGFLGAALGVYLHQLWMIWVFLGLIGGVGLGLGYISPVSTLVRWFPDRRGMATGMAIMGFGGGALIGYPLASLLMNHFRGPGEMGVWQTMAVMGAIYFVVMTAGALAYRIPPDGWRPEGWTPPATGAMISRHSVALADAHRTPQFWLIWAVLCLNVSAGIGVLAMASPMLQEIFAGGLIGHPEQGFKDLTAEQLQQVARIAAGFGGLLSLFNILGRLFWASASDRLGRKTTFFVFFALGFALYALSPTLAHAGQKGLFVAAFCVILSMYGGGFATVPAYLADLFGTRYVGAIHGRLLTAWSTAGVVGPLLVSYIRDAQIAAGVERALVYDRTMYILAGFLVVGFLCNALVRPVAPKWRMNSEAVDTTAPEREASDVGVGGAFTPALGLAWALVLVPIAWGVWQTLQSASHIFQ